MLSQQTGSWAASINSTAEPKTMNVRANRSQKRRGSMLIMIAFMMIFLLVFSAMIINLSYMQLVDTEMRAATDASARAAAESLARGDSVAEARDEAKRIAAANTVGGRPLELRDTDIVFGFASAPETGRSVFSTNGDEINAVRILGRRDDTAAGGSVAMLFQGFLDETEFTTVRAATARIQERDFCLVLDRSGSMAATDGGRVNGINIPRIVALQIACGAFVQVLDETIGREQLAVASYSTSSTKDIPLSFDYAQSMDFVTSLRANGLTNIGMGIDDGVALLMDPSRHRLIARPVLVVMTDGQHNQNRDPEVAAREAMARFPNMLIHTVTFSPAADRGRMQRVAAIGNGRHHHATDIVELKAVFEEIARTAGTSLVE